MEEKYTFKDLYRPKRLLTLFVFFLITLLARMYFLENDSFLSMVLQSLFVTAFVSIFPVFVGKKPKEHEV